MASSIGFRRLLRGVVVGMGVTVGLGLVAPAESQDVGNLRRANKDPGVIRAQLQLGLTYERQALAAIAGGADQAAMRELYRVIEQGYVFIRFAQHGVSLRIVNANPHVAAALYAPAEKRLLEAMKRVRGALVAVQEAGAWGVAPKYVEAAVASLEGAIALVEEVLNLI